MAYFVMLVCGSLALEVKSEVDEAVLERCSVFPRLAPSQRSRQTRSWQRVLLREDLVISPTIEVGGSRFDSQNNQSRKGMGYLFMVSRPNLSAPEQSRLHESLWYVVG